MYVNIICKYILLITFLNEPELSFLSTQLNGFQYFYLIRIILFTINNFLAQVRYFQVFPLNSNNLTSVICLHTFK